MATTKKPATKKVAVAKVPAKKTVKFRVQRNTREGDQVTSRWQEYDVEYDPSTTVLQALEDVKGQQDGSLTFRRSCRASICGSCGMFINNRSRLACKTKVSDLVDGVPEKNIEASDVIEVTPQKNQPVLKDLAVDITEFYDKVHKIEPFVKEGSETEKDVAKDSFEQVNMVSNCIMCGSGYSDCTAMVENPDYLGPAALAKAFRFVADPREGDKTNRLKELSEKNGVWDCTRCGMCIDACPKDVAPMEAIVKLRSRAIDAGVTDNPGAGHAMAFKKDFKMFGVLNEALLIPRTVGVTGMFGQIGNALNLIKKGKIPEVWPTGHVKGMDEVRSIFKELEENPINVETKAEDSGPGAG